MYPAPLGTRLAVGGLHLWLNRSGTGGPAVVILPRGGAIGLDYLNIHEGVARRATGVIYDRAGTGGAIRQICRAAQRVDVHEARLEQVEREDRTRPPPRSGESRTSCIIAMR